jgi:hypothetical protein
MTCDRCGATLEISDWPWCPHGRGANTVVADSIPGGLVVENGFETPITVYSHSEHRRRLAENGYEQRVKWAGEHDRHVTRWDTVDLDAAKTLLERGPQARRDKQQRWPNATTPITVTEVGTFTRKDVDI